MLIAKSLALSVLLIKYNNFILQGFELPEIAGSFLIRQIIVKRD